MSKEFSEEEKEVIENYIYACDNLMLLYGNSEKAREVVSKYFDEKILGPPENKNEFEPEGLSEYLESRGI